MLIVWHAFNVKIEITQVTTIKNGSWLLKTLRVNCPE